MEMISFKALVTYSNNSSQTKEFLTFASARRFGSLNKDVMFIEVASTGNRIYDSTR